MPHHVTALQPLLLVPLLTSCVPTGTPVTDDAGALEGRPRVDAGGRSVHAPATVEDAAAPDGSRALDAGVPADAAEAGAMPCSAPCAEPTTHCDLASDQCVACTSDAHCSGTGARCIEHTCIECVTDSECTGVRRPHCAGGACVECLGDGDCPTDQPHCVDRSCFECRVGQAADCVGNPRGAACYVGGCSECAEHADCTNPQLARCAGGLCTPCDSDEACAGRKNGAGDPLEVCDQGTCVECTSTRREACKVGSNHYVCDSTQRACTQAKVGSADMCDPCVSDAQCVFGSYCMHTSFSGTDTGLFCLYPPPASGCAVNRPFTFAETTWTSVDGVSTTVCRLRHTTCQAYNAIGKFCSGPDAAGDEMCGVASLQDGYCHVHTGSLLCTTPCADETDCTNVFVANPLDECQARTTSAGSLLVCGP